MTILNGGSTTCESCCPFPRYRAPQYGPSPFNPRSYTTLAMYAEFSAFIVGGNYTSFRSALHTANPGDTVAHHPGLIFQPRIQNLIPTHPRLGTPTGPVLRTVSRVSSFMLPLQIVISNGTGAHSCSPRIPTHCELCISAGDCCTRTIVEWRLEEVSVRSTASAGTTQRWRSRKYRRGQTSR